MTNPSRLRTLLLLGAALPLLSGCFGAAVVAAGSGVLLAADRRASETYVTDEGIELRIVSRTLEILGNRAHVNVTSYNRSVLLSGEAVDAATRAEVERIAAATPNVRAISNEVVVGPASSLSARANDSVLTSKVKARFIDHNRFAANHVKVVTEAGTVFLLGLVTQAEADAAVEIARTTGGVQKVVRVFEIISPEQARALDGPAPQKK
jgi:osmotically-inducible protein OsmY